MIAVDAFEKIDHNIKEILTSLGRDASAMDSVAYDTAWVARLAAHFSGQDFERALAWLRRHQHADGSWGGRIMHYHDRVISTLSAIVALHLADQNAEDAERVRAGETFLWRECGRMNHDANDTGGFPVLTLALTREALQLGLDIPHNLYSDVAKIEKKLNMLGLVPQTWRDTTLALSIEALHEYVTDYAAFVDEDGSVMASPSSTASVLIYGQTNDSRSLRYVQDAAARQGDGGAPFVAPFDIYESAWTLNHLRLAGAIQPDDPEVRRILDFLWDMWSPQHGVAFTSRQVVRDLDDTAVAFTMLRWGGYPVSADVFAAYEDERHFRCWSNELDPSLSVNIRTIAALQTETQHKDFERWNLKIAAMLRRYDLHGYFWFDKWHISPYYLTATAVWSLHGVVDDLLPLRIRWILKTQRPDGGWGYYSQSTAEETAYCLQALLLWDRKVERIDPAYINAAGRFLTDHLDDTHYPEMWIGKSLYMPRHLVRSAMLMALHSYRDYLNGG